MSGNKVVHQDFGEAIYEDRIKMVPFTRYIQSPEIDASFSQMQREADAESDDCLSYEDKRDRWMNTMMNVHIDYQRSMGVAIPSAEKAQKKIIEIYERMVQSGEIDFHRPIPKGKL